MAKAIRVSVCIGGNDIMNMTVRENYDVYGLSRDIIIGSIERATQCDTDEFREHLISLVYNARIDGKADTVIDTNMEYKVSLVYDTEDALAGYNLVG